MHGKIKNIFQIYYDEETYNLCDSRLHKLRNINPKFPQLYEFSPIYEYLSSISIDFNAYYGFLSPRFYSKTLVDIGDLLQIIERNDTSYDVYLCTSGWDQICYFMNSFEQGEYFHPGLISATNDFIEFAGLNISLDAMIGTLTNTVNSNYIVASGMYWNRWLGLAEKFVQFYQDVNNNYSSIRATTRYRNNPEMAVFLQERLHQFLLWNFQYNVISIDTTQTGPMLNAMFDDTASNRVLLRACDVLKSELLNGFDLGLMDAYLKLRSVIKKKI